MKLALIVAALAAATSVFAQQFPSKPVRMIAGFAPGSGADLAGRVVADALSEALKVQVVVENRPGGNGLIAINAMRAADPDGHTILWSFQGPLGVAPLLDPKLSGLEKPWDPTADFAVAGFVGRFDGMFVTGAPGPKSMQELIEQLRSPSGNVTWASTSVGSTNDLAQEYMVYVVKGRATPVGYKSAVVALPDLLAGRLTFTITAPTPQNLSLLKEGKLRALAVLSRERLSSVPEIPSLSEVGLQEMLEIDWDAWFGVFARKQTPQPVLERLNEALRRMLADASYREKLGKTGLNPYAPASQRESQARWEKSFPATRAMLGKLGQLPK